MLEEGGMAPQMAMSVRNFNFKLRGVGDDEYLASAEYQRDKAELERKNQLRVC